MPVDAICVVCVVGDGGLEGAVALALSVKQAFCDDRLPCFLAKAFMIEVEVVCLIHC